MTWTHGLPEAIAVALAEAVEKVGGDLDDLHDLAECWERLHADAGGRVDRMHFENRQRKERSLAERQEDSG